MDQFKAIAWWPNAYHVMRGKTRVGIVNARELDSDHKIWYAHNKHFVNVGQGFPTRDAAAKVLKSGSLRQGA